MIPSRPSALLIVAIAACAVLAPSHARAQWWSGKPDDFETCADKAEKAATKEEKSSKLSECHSKFAGRRKAGGGYSYFDFMQNKHFDIAGPNPTPEEQKHIDEQYTAYLDKQRRSTIAAAFAAKQQQVKLQQASLRSGAEKVPVPRESPAKQHASAPAGDSKSRTRAAYCARNSFSCEWPRLSEGIKDLKKTLFGATAKAKRG